MMIAPIIVEAHGRVIRNSWIKWIFSKSQIYQDHIFPNTSLSQKFLQYYSNVKRQNSAAESYETLKVMDHTGP